MEPATSPDPRKKAFPGLCLPDNETKAKQLLDEGNIKVATDAISEVFFFLSNNYKKMWSRGIPVSFIGRTSRFYSMI